MAICLAESAYLGPSLARQKTKGFWGVITRSLKMVTTSLAIPTLERVLQLFQVRKKHFVGKISGSIAQCMAASFAKFWGKMFEDQSNLKNFFSLDIIWWSVNSKSGRHTMSSSSRWWTTTHNTLLSSSLIPNVLNAFLIWRRSQLMVGGVSQSGLTLVEGERLKIISE